jgi:hypothetical protein
MIFDAEFSVFPCARRDEKRASSHVDHASHQHRVCQFCGVREVTELIAPIPLVSSRTFHCMACGPSRYVKYNGFRLVIFDRPLYFFQRFSTCGSIDVCVIV